MEDVADAPAYAATTLDGATFDLEAHRGEVVLVNVWATWCEPCREELPELARLHREHERDGLVVVGVSTDAARNAEKVRRMVTEYDLPYPIVHDADNVVVTTFKVVGYPTSFLVDRRGRLRWRRDGIIPNGDAELATALRTALAGD